MTEEFEPAPAAPATRTLIAGARAGDQMAREALYQRFHEPLVAWLHGRLPAHAREVTDTVDLVQDALMRSLSRLDGFEETRQRGFLRYLQASVMNGLRKEIRAVRLRLPRAEMPEDIASQARTPLDEVLSREQQSLYKCAMQSLSGAEQDLVIARLEMEMSFREIAIHLARPSADAARVAFNRALRKLAERLTELHGEA